MDRWGGGGVTIYEGDAIIWKGQQKYMGKNMWIQDQLTLLPPL